MKVEISLSQFGLENSEKRRYFISREGEVSVLKTSPDGKEKITKKQTSLNNGYPVIWVYKNSKGARTAIYIRDMVAMAFCDYDKNDDNQKIINVDLDKKNNSAENIKVVTPDEWRSHYDSTFKRMKGVDRSQNPPNSKLTVKQVKEVKLILKVSKNIPEIAKKFGVSQVQIYRIKKGINWKQI